MTSRGDRRVALHGLSILAAHLLLGVFMVYLPNRPLKTLFILCVGSWFSTALMLHIHEAAHGLVFGPGHPWLNRFYGMLMNLGLGLPAFSFFKRHHKNHHKHIGDEVLDTEYPSEWEARVFGATPPGKWFWFLANPVIFTIRRPTFIVKHFVWDMSFEEAINLATFLPVHFCLIFFVNEDFWIYLAYSNFWATAAHMFGFWGVISHVQLLKNKETTSYYGWMNFFFLNFGYHMEHHDFPGVPSRFLPEITKMAPEFYEETFTFDSLYSAVIKYIFDEKFSIGNRLKRVNETPWKFMQKGEENFRKFQ